MLEKSRVDLALEPGEFTGDDRTADRAEDAVEHNHVVEGGADVQFTAAGISRTRIVLAGIASAGIASGRVDRGVRVGWVGWVGRVRRVGTAGRAADGVIGAVGPVAQSASAIVEGQRGALFDEHLFVCGVQRSALGLVGASEQIDMLDRQLAGTRGTNHGGQRTHPASSVQFGATRPNRAVRLSRQAMRSRARPV